MADMQGQTQLVLAQNQHAFIQDTTKGIVQVYAGPHSGAVSQNERPVIYDRAKDEFIGVRLEQAVKQNPLVAEGEYLVLENPLLKDNGTPVAPTRGGNAPAELRIGSKINIPGPLTCPLWPGQFATVVPGHHLRSNQYLVVRVYNAEEATTNGTVLLGVAAGRAGTEDANFTPGQLLVIKGTEASFFIPPTGFEVLKENNGAYVREALTLERLEYAILLDEDGNKRYERGPQVVFPEATEQFLTRKGEEGGSRKFKAIELNDQMGLYIKVIADYSEPIRPQSDMEAVSSEYDIVTVDGESWVAERHVTGEELFITGKEQRIYYPRPEHALIGYDDPKSNFKRERYYGITIPKGEGRYVLDKTAGDIKMVRGPQIFLPDPRNQVIVRRVLSTKAVDLWYPGNTEALAFNEGLRALTDESATFLSESTVQSAMADLSRGMNRLTSSNVSYGGTDVVAGSGQRMSRSKTFTPPPMLTLNNKYDGVPSIDVWTGYAVQVVDRSGARRVIAGPTTILLEYDETLEMLTLSTGKPKNTDAVKHDVYLRVDHNLVSDIVSVETKDLVMVEVRLSYRVNFLQEHKDKWFAVENYVKYLCDHMRSLLKAGVKRVGISELIDNSVAIIRDAVLGTRSEYTGPQTGEAGDTAGGKVQRHRFFPENGMDVYDVELLGVTIKDNKVAGLLTQAQTKAVEAAITLSGDEANLVATKRRTAINIEMAEMAAQQAQHTYRTQADTEAVQAELAMKSLESELMEERRRQEGETAREVHFNAMAEHQMSRRKAIDEADTAMETARTAAFKERMNAITPNLIQALQTMGEVEFSTRLSEAIAPLALAEQSGLGQTLERVFKGTPIAKVLENIQSR